jgi:hypothetical protein
MGVDNAPKPNLHPIRAYALAIAFASRGPPMTPAGTARKFVSSFASLATFAAMPVLLSTPASGATPVAYVYVQTNPGVNVYTVDTAGQLTLIKGSPFADSGQMEGNNSSYLIAVGTDYLHSYKIESNGAVGPQAAQIDTQSYDGSQCGNTNGGEPNGAQFDHSGHDFYVQLFGAPGSGGVEAACAAWQSYRIESDGAFTFLGAIQYNGNQDHEAAESSIPTVSSNDAFAYGIFQEFGGYSYTDLSTFTRNSGGTLEVNNGFTEKDPATNPNMAGGPWAYFPVQVQADPSGHLAVMLVSESFNNCCGAYGPLQLASYTINGSGGISSTNTWENMPTPALSSIGSMDMSPSGKLLAVAGDGLQVFHFNGTSPVTAFGSPLLTNVTIDQLGLDSSNHLYALSYSSGELYVYTATPTSITPVSGSPYKVTGAYGVKGMIVVN